MYLLSVSIISGAAISYELLLMRLMSIVQWHHFAYMIISLALLGFGASGSFLVLTKQWFLQRLKYSLCFISFCFSITSILCFFLIQKIPFNPLELPWTGFQFVYLSMNYLILMMPFFCAATYVGLVFIAYNNKLEEIYFYDLIGSAIGVILIIFSLFVIEPQNCLRVVFLLGFIVFALNLPIVRYKFFLGILTVSFGVLVAYGLPNDLTSIDITKYKPLSKILQIPGNQIIKEVSSPRGLITVVETREIPLRYAPGLSIKNQSELPEQMAMFIDGDSLSAINNFNNDFSEIDYMNYMTDALPYYLVKNPNVFIVGLGGGKNIMQSLYFNSKKIDVVEINPQIVGVLKEEYNNYAGKIYDLSKIKIHIGEARNFLKHSQELYDLIQIPSLESYSSSYIGLGSFNVSHLYTVEAIENYMQKLEHNGILSITNWTKIPPRTSLKLFSTVIQSLEEQNIEFPERNILMIRSWKTTTMVVKKSPFTQQDINILKLFCKNRSFDIVYYPGVKKNEINRFNLLSKPFFYEGVTHLLTSDRRNYEKNYKFNIKPSRDDQPFFFNFFKWSSFSELMQLRSQGTVSMIDWGYIILVATFFIAFMFSFLFILLPLRYDRGLKKIHSKKNIVSYFFLIGLSFMFIEIILIQRFILFFGFPLYAIAFIIVTLLFFAGIGSLYSKRLSLKMQKTKTSFHAIDIAIIGLIVILITHVFFLTPIFERSFSLNWIPKLLISFLIVAPLAFFMGMPFPLGLTWIKKTFEQGIPWAWGINGCASVIGSILSILLLMHFGYTIVTFLVVIMYLTALVIFKIVFLKINNY